MGEYKLTILSGFVELLSKQYMEVLTDKTYKFSEEEINALRKIYRLMQTSSVIGNQLADYEKKRQKQKKWPFQTLPLRQWKD